MLKKLRLSLLITLFIIITPSYAKTIVVLGDSLSAAYGIQPSEGWVALLKQKLRVEDLNFKVLNLSTSGDTSINSLTKIRNYYKKNDIKILIIQIGSNDALRGLSLSQLKKNILAIISIAKKNNSLILLLANRFPPNYGNKFTMMYQELFNKIAKDENIPIVDQLLKGVAENSNLMQADGLHPKVKAQSIMLDNIWLLLKPLILSSKPCKIK
tara:strand:+ start:426 stop:1061 length:636 start_codon:yes stop_codon:yes gene_type:complete